VLWIGIVIHTHKPLQPFAPSFSYPLGQLPHEMEPAAFLHLRLLSQPPLFVRHASAFVGVVVAFVVAALVVVHFTVCSETAEFESFVFSQQVLKWLHHPSG